MGQFSDKLVLQHGFSDHKVIWTLYVPLSYTTSEGWTITVPDGFQTDLASVPRIFWNILPPYWSYAKAAVLHDYLLVSGFDVRIANDLFEDAMHSLHENKNRVRIMMFFVRGFLNTKQFVKKLWRRFKK